MDDLKEIKTDIKEIKKNVNEIHLVLARNTQSVEHHVKRSDLSEARIYRVEQWLLGLLSALVIGIIIRLIL